MIKFPKDFLWGAATSSYQVEGGNANADWWKWEIKAGKERSGFACRHYELYKKDFDLAKGLHHNAHRLSIEWSRIEPKQGRFSRKELKHYLDVILALRKRNIEPIVTLHHFTNPLWFSKAGGWLNPVSADRFLRYCQYVIPPLAKHVRYWVTVNEPGVYISHSYIFGVWPPQERSYLKAAAVEENLARAHIKAFRLIHKVYKEASLYKPSVGVAQNIMAFSPRKKDFKNRLAAFVRDKLYNLGFLERIKPYMDFVGVNYYSRQVVDLKKIWLKNIAGDVRDEKLSRCEKNSLGWDVYPRGIYEVLMEIKRYKLPVIITENGICTSDDKQRWRYIYNHLKYVHLAMHKGVPVKGYLYWSLLDNFEWDKGFKPRFGLINIDYKTQKRTVRKSARKFAQVCKTAMLPSRLI